MSPVWDGGGECLPATSYAPHPHHGGFFLPVPVPRLLAGPRGDPQIQEKKMEKKEVKKKKKLTMIKLSKNYITLHKLHKMKNSQRGKYETPVGGIN